MCLPWPPELVISDNGLGLVTGLQHRLCVECVELVFISIFEHFFCMHGFFFFPGPPNLGLSKQNLHAPQSSARHPVHSPHLLRLLPEINNCFNYRILMVIDMLNLPVVIECPEVD